MCGSLVSTILLKICYPFKFWSPNRNFPIFSPFFFSFSLLQLPSIFLTQNPCLKLLSIWKQDKQHLLWFLVFSVSWFNILKKWVPFPDVWRNVVSCSLVMFFRCQVVTVQRGGDVLAIWVGIPFSFNVISPLFLGLVFHNLNFRFKRWNCCTWGWNK